MTSKLEDLESNPPDSIIEKGHIYFLYRPKVALDHAEKIEDVQKLILVLSPGLVRKNLAKTNLEVDDKDASQMQSTKVETNTEATKEAEASETEGIPENIGEPLDNKKRKIPTGYEEITNHELPKYRSIVIGKKRLPDTKSKERIWGYVNKTANSLNELHQVLDEEHYKTASMGERTLEKCRPMGEGIYAIVCHERHTHLVYVLQFPEKLGEIQREFNIVKEGSYIISVKNPEAGNPNHLGLSEEEKTGFPKKLQQEFKGRKWAPLETTDFLEHESCEIVLIGATEKVHHEHTEVDEYLREAVEIDKLDWDKQDEGQEVRIIKKLKLSMETPIEALFGKWA
ncbi:hypothetical protein K493DRAFT_352188 [Basidiobolus meristosporus CBS 931.73]|uniref:Uncharacterized protein n=1 Tax=Basidiobolus meristosporus CBS 931.73 TaxID=1314790 RepID=A0A1Y1YAK3_9FUNG|nr:hypothetical protein K493DRAFT_352188 [Basidiobolus meristosporus CBS 931.73]|eukprot:ORX94796.1 hypothetical protein K493DRAFT_352188 [Basidiobolus meristosporus CBS 931.73]